MAGGSSSGAPGVKVVDQRKVNNTIPMIIMTALFFMIGFITVFNDVLVPSLKNLFHLEVWQATLIQFCFFMAYGVMSYPSGMIIKNMGYKKGLMIGLAFMGAGLLLFVPASVFISYGMFLVALFIVASGLTILQVAINPYISALGPPETAASRLNLGGAFNSLATFIGPIIGGATVLAGMDGLSDVEKAEHVRGPYIMLAVLTLIIAIFLKFIKLPKLATESKDAGPGSAWDYRNLNFGAFAIFFYVGAEVAIGTILIVYLNEAFGVKEELGSSFLAYYWGGAMIGRFAGSAFLQKIKAEKALATVSAVAFGLICLSMTGFMLDSWTDVWVFQLKELNVASITVPFAAICLVLVGLFNSIMWPSIFPLGIKGLGKHTSQGSGIMVTMVVGGAVLPVLQGALVDGIGYRFSFVLLLVSYAYIFFFAVNGHKSKKSTEELKVVEPEE